MKKISVILALLCSFGTTLAQSDTTPRKRIAIFAPLYLDSAFDQSGNYRYNKSMPKFFNAGLEFYQGIQLAIDSLEKENIKLEIDIYDTRSKEKLDQILQKKEIQQTSLFIGHVSLNEAALLGRVANNLHIPFVNVNIPNDADSRNNPNYILLNPTLSTHISAIYRFLQKNYALSPIIYFRKKGSTDDRLRSIFTNTEKTTASVPLKMRYTILDDTVSTEQLSEWIDTSRTTVCLIGSLDLNFTLNLCRQLATVNKNYKITVLTMPLVDQVDFGKSVYKGIEIIYTSPTFINPDNKQAQQIQSVFKTRYFSRAGDMVFTAFDALYFFAHQVSTIPNGAAFPASLHGTTVFGEFSIEPINNRQSGVVDYLENKKLYFIKKVDGQAKVVN